MRKGRAGTCVSLAEQVRNARDRPWWDPHTFVSACVSVETRVCVYLFVTFLTGTGQQERRSASWFSDQQERMSGIMVFRPARAHERHHGFQTSKSVGVASWFSDQQERRSGIMVSAQQERRSGIMVQKSSDAANTAQQGGSTEYEGAGSQESRIEERNGTLFQNV
jgi:hypothetical protein